VIGLTGAGKSSIIKTLTASDVHIEHSINAGTSTFTMFPTIIDGQRYILIDTPGFNDENRDDVEIFQEILNWFVTMTPYCDLSGILYIHDITHHRFDGAASLNLQMLQALCGKQFYKNVTIITTMWREMNPAATKKAEKRL
ncbi:P-loop containing nucleoside triphosphate hydrolase protein, partial [Wilcoxina mikolae CBS 423.85]